MAPLLLWRSPIGTLPADEQSAPQPSRNASPKQLVLGQFIDADCHDNFTRKAGLALDDLRSADIGQNPKKCATLILSSLMRWAYRRPVVDEDLETPMKRYRQGRVGSSFDAGIEMARRSVLVSPQFLSRIELDPAGVLPAGLI